MDQRPHRLPPLPQTRPPPFGPPDQATVTGHGPNQAQGGFQLPNLLNAVGAVVANALQGNQQRGRANSGNNEGEAVTGGGGGASLGNTSSFGAYAGPPGRQYTYNALAQATEVGAVPVAPM